jgi:hypothetical protein
MGLLNCPALMVPLWVNSIRWFQSSSDKLIIYIFSWHLQDLLRPEECKNCSIIFMVTIYLETPVAMTVFLAVKDDLSIFTHNPLLAPVMKLTFIMIVSFY